MRRAERKPRAGAPLFVPQAALLARKPDADFGPMKAWDVERDETAAALHVCLCGILPLHRHPDGTHRLYMLSGRMRLRIESQERVLGPGDYARIPVGAAHRAVRVGKKPARYVTVDVPPIDPAKIEWLERVPSAAKARRKRRT